MRTGTESIKFLLMIYLLFYLYNFFEVQGYDEILLQAFWLYLHISQKKPFKTFPFLLLVTLIVARFTAVVVFAAIV